MTDINVVAICAKCGKPFKPVRWDDKLCYICDEEHTICYVFDPEIEMHCNLPRKSK